MDDNQIIPRLQAFSASLQGKIYVWGGRALDSSRKFVHPFIPMEERKRDPTLYCYDPSEGEWTLLQTTGHSPPLELHHGASASMGTHLYSCGGFDGTYYDPYLYRLDVGALKWERLPSYPQVDDFFWREGCKMVCNQQKLVLAGGSLSNIHTYPGPNEGSLTTRVDVHAFDFEDGTWSSPKVTGTQPPPIDCCSFTAIDEHRAVLLGGGVGPCFESFISELFVFVLHLDQMYWEEMSYDKDEPHPYWEMIGGAVYLKESSKLLVTAMKSGCRSEMIPMPLNRAAWLLDIHTWRWRKLMTSQDFEMSPDGYCTAIMSSQLPIAGSSVLIFGGAKSMLSNKKEVYSPTTLLVFGLQSLQELCLAAIKSAIQQSSMEPDQAVAKLPNYVPTRIRKYITLQLKTFIVHYRFNVRLY